MYVTHSLVCATNLFRFSRELQKAKTEAKAAVEEAQREVRIFTRQKVSKVSSATIFTIGQSPIRDMGWLRLAGSLIDTSLLQNVVSFIGLFCKSNL